MDWIGHHNDIALAAAAVGRRLKVRWDPQIQTTSNERVMKLLRQESDDIPWKPWRKRWAGPLLACGAKNSSNSQSRSSDTTCG